MRRYSQWLGSLAPYHRAELQELAPDRRVQQIKRLQAEQAKQAKTSAHSHTAKDRQGIVAWLERYAREHEAGLLEMMPEARRRQLAKAAAAGRRAVLLFLLERWQSGNAVVHPPMSDKQLLELRSVLSPRPSGVCKPSRQPSRPAPSSPISVRRRAWSFPRVVAKIFPCRPTTNNWPISSSTSSATKNATG